MTDEYEYKSNRGTEMRDWLAEDELISLLAEQRPEEICQRVVRSFTMDGALARWDEYQWLRNLDQEESKTFTEALLAYLYGDTPFLERLDAFVQEVTPVYRHYRKRDPSAAKQYKRQTLTWPFVSYFHFMMWPQECKYCFLKPMPLGNAARAAGFDLKYGSTPNASTYRRTQDFYEALWPLVQERGGRDWIDVQTLIHVAGGGFGVPKGGWADQRPTPEEAWRTELKAWLAGNPRTAPSRLAQLRNAFVERFPKEDLGEMTLEEYALGHEGSKDSFCYWLEWETEDLGSVRGGAVSKFGIWWSKEHQTWRWNKAMGAKTAQEAWHQLRRGLVTMVETVEADDYEHLDEVGARVLGPNRYSLRAKPLNLYFPEDFLPIASPDHLAHFLEWFGLQPEGDLHAMNLQLLDFLRDQDEFEGFDTQQMMRFLYDAHRPGATQTEPDNEGDEVEVDRVPALLPPALDHIQAHIDTSDFVFSRQSIANYHLSLLTKPFVILTGLSGTGKTALTRLYADAVHGIPNGEMNPYYRLVAVRPDWNDHRGLLGYYNPLTETYHATPFLRFLLEAESDPSHWYYVCLDEMNLARVEYYYSDFLSALEANDRLRLHPFKGQCIPTRHGDGIDPRVSLPEAASWGYKTGDILYIPDSIPIPSNLLVTGTVNVDETTHAFSDKVLDRANSIELNHADLDAYMRRYTETHPDRADIVNAAKLLLLDVYKILEPHYLHFGYRTLQEILNYLWHNAILPEQSRLPMIVALDNQIMQKVLPKLRGDERIETSLVELRDRLQRELGEDSRSVRKVNWMLEELRIYGSTHFWR